MPVPVRLRLARWGLRNNPFYGIVATHSRSPRDRKEHERLGNYNPIPDKAGIKYVELNVERIKYWLSVGAQPSDRVAWLLHKAGLMPLPPRQLQRKGLIDMSDKSTWSIQINDTDGKSLGLLSSRDINGLQGPQNETLKRKFDEAVRLEQLRDTFVASRGIKSRDVVLHGNVELKQPLESDELVVVMKRMLGLRI